jgi:hypothetical protein
MQKIVIPISMALMTLIAILKLRAFYATYDALFTYDDKKIPPSVVPRFFKESEIPIKDTDMTSKKHTRNATLSTQLSKLTRVESPKNKNAREDIKRDKNLHFLLNISFIFCAIVNFASRYLLGEHNVGSVYFLLIPVLVGLTPSKRRDVEVFIFISFVITAVVVLLIKPVRPSNNLTNV